MGILRAMVINLWYGEVRQGGSTLTQQLVKNRFLSADRTFRRKMQELILAFLLEQRYSKAEILAAYLNSVYFGAGSYGVAAAAQEYFGKKPAELSLRESALLAGLLRAPSHYSPKNDPNSAAQRTELVLDAMVDAGFLSSTERKALSEQAPPPRRKPGGAGDGRYFADWVADQVFGMLGDDKSTPQQIVVRTTLDWRLQQNAERATQATLEQGRAQQVTQAAVVVLAPDGAVRTMVGGRDYRESQFNRATQALRSPGSSFKPFVYLAALEAGAHPSDIIDDAPVTFGDYAPRNFEDRYAGSTTLAHALAISANSVAVNLINRVRPETVVRLAQRFGITAKLEPNLSLALGTNGVSLLEMTGAYAGIAAGGRAVLPYAILEVRTEDGRILFRHTEAVSPSVARPFAVSDLIEMMQGVIREGTGRAADLGRPAAAKTGTADDYRDAWFLGFTGQNVAGVWMGNDDNRPMQKVTGGGLPAQLWRTTMLAAEEGREALPLFSMATDRENGGEGAAPINVDGLMERLFGR